MATTVSPVLGVAAGAFAFTSNVADADTVVIGDKTYTFKTTPAAAYDVDVGADLDTSIGNLVAAINASGTPALTTYYTGTVQNPYVSAAADLTNDEVDLTARFAGSWVNGLYLAATHPGANDITAAAVTFGGVDDVPGEGLVQDHLDDIIDLNQVNAEVLAELKKLTAAAD